MATSSSSIDSHRWVLRRLESPAKVLATAVILVFGLAMVGALGQIAVHEIIPMTAAGAATEPSAQVAAGPAAVSATGVGDLFADTPAIGATAMPHDDAVPSSLLDDEQFVWTLRWSHIHLFGMNMIFILMGPITLMLDKPARTRGWLVALPFAGVAIDIAAMWLKNFVSPVFFWLHVPGGLMFGGIFAYVSFAALREMWGGDGIQGVGGGQTHLMP